MANEGEQTQTQTASPASSPKRHRLFWVIVPLLVIAVGVFVAVAFVQTAPEAKRRAPDRQARLVEVQSVTFGSQRAEIHAMGVVQAAREVALRPQVSGQIQKVGDEFVPGGRFREGEMLVQIDPADFELVLRQRQSDLAQAQTELALELGQQTVAKREFELLGETIKEEDRALVLRQPQLERVRARVQAAEAAVAQAQLNLERATVRVPFNAVVRSREANLGMQVSPTSTLAVLTGTDAYWVEVTVPVDQLPWIEVPGAAVEIFNEAAWGATVSRHGRVVRLLSDLEQQGRMARLLVEVADPMALQPANAGKPKLLLGDYVRVKIAGIEMPHVAALDRTLVREGHNVWVMTPEKKLEIRPVQIVFRGRERLFIRDSLKTGEWLVTTDLASPVAGMPLRTREDAVKDGKKGK